MIELIMYCDMHEKDMLTDNNCFCEYSTLSH